MNTKHSKITLLPFIEEGKDIIANQFIKQDILFEYALSIKYAITNENSKNPNCVATVYELKKTGYSLNF